MTGRAVPDARTRACICLASTETFEVLPSAVRNMDAWSGSRDCKCVSAGVASCRASTASISLDPTRAILGTPAGCVRYAGIYAQVSKLEWKPSPACETGNRNTAIACPCNGSLRIMVFGVRNTREAAARLDTSRAGPVFWFQLCHTTWLIMGSLGEGQDFAAHRL